MSDLRPTRQFWCPDIVQPPEMRDLAIARIKAGDECIEFHAHSRSTKCEGFSEPMFARADEEAEWHRVYHHDRCWRHPS